MKFQNEQVEENVRLVLEMWSRKIGFESQPTRFGCFKKCLTRFFERTSKQTPSKDDSSLTALAQSQDQTGHQSAPPDHVLEVQQALRYAEDLAKIYQEEKARRSELQAANQRLGQEVVQRKQVEQDLKSALSQLIIAQRKLHHRADHDELTGLLNRRALLERLRQELSRARREGKPLGVIMMDVDHFKRINDTLGHVVGDAVLKEITKRIGSALRPYDLVGRYGGEELLAVLPGCDEAAAVKLAERLRLSIAAQGIPTDRGSTRVTMSLGVTAVDARDESDLDAIILDADAALYTAKKSGRNCVIVTERTPHQKALEREVSVVEPTQGLTALG